MHATMLPRIVPFILFMCFIGVEEVGRLLAGKGLIELSEQFFLYLYPVKALSVASVLFLFRKKYREIDLRQLVSVRSLVVSVLCGIMVFVVWIRMDFSVDPTGTAHGFNPLVIRDDAVRLFLIVMRLVGAVLVVPVMEELFWRSFILRSIVNQDFHKVPIGSFTWPSFLITTLLFGLEHDLFLAGIMAGIAYNLLVYYTRSIAHCILAHAITNLMLGIYVLVTQRWYFW